MHMDRQMREMIIPSWVIRSEGDMVKLVNVSRFDGCCYDLGVDSDFPCFCIPVDVERHKASTYAITSTELCQDILLTGRRELTHLLTVVLQYSSADGEPHHLISTKLEDDLALKEVAVWLKIDHGSGLDRDLYDRPHRGLNGQRR
ncbi:hypothetical protein INR49_019493 [Caranx melampygus]|nr:hypothetical protein INR49_019493 [Caranx melampygus]